MDIKKSLEKSLRDLQSEKSESPKEELLQSLGSLLPALADLSDQVKDALALSAQVNALSQQVDGLQKQLQESSQLTKSLTIQVEAERQTLKNLTTFLSELSTLLENGETPNTPELVSQHPNQIQPTTSLEADDVTAIQFDTIREALTPGLAKLPQEDARRIIELWLFHFDDAQSFNDAFQFFTVPSGERETVKLLISILRADDLPPDVISQARQLANEIERLL